MENTDKEFSDGFMQDLADLLQYCMENNTDSVELGFYYNEKRLQVDITFSVRQVVQDVKID